MYRSTDMSTRTYGNIKAVLCYCKHQYLWTWWLRIPKGADWVWVMCTHGGWCSPQPHINFLSANAPVRLSLTSSAASTAVCGELGALPQLVSIFLLCGRKTQGHTPICTGRYHYLSNLILGHTTTVVETPGCRAENLPACLLWKTE